MSLHGQPQQGGANAFDRIQALLKAISQPQGLQQAAQQLAAQNVQVPDIAQIQQLAANVPNPGVQRQAGQGQVPQGQVPGQIPGAVNAAPQSIFGGLNPGQGVVGIDPQAGFLPTPQLNRAPVLPQQAQAFGGGFSGNARR